MGIHRSKEHCLDIANSRYKKPPECVDGANKKTPETFIPRVLILFSVCL